MVQHEVVKWALKDWGGNVVQGVVVDIEVLKNSALAEFWWKVGDGVFMERKVVEAAQAPDTRR